MGKETLHVWKPRQVVLEHHKITISNLSFGRLAIIGNKLQKILSSSMPESEIRLIIQGFMDKTKCRATIMVEGNRVWASKYILRNFSEIIRFNDMNRMTRESYEFLSSVTGSSAHYNMYGWISEYPSVDSLARYFGRNEFGMPVLENIPGWYSDAMYIAKEIDWMLKNRRALQALA